MYSMIFLYKTRHCPLVKTGKECTAGETYCFDSHETEKCKRRRRPFIPQYSRDWNYTVEKCTTGYPNCPENCSHGPKCRNCHTSAEMRYHPLFYKTAPCNNEQYKSTGICSFGPRCWMYHQNDRRYPDKQFIPPSINHSTGIDKTSPPPLQFINWQQWKLQKNKQLKAICTYVSARIYSNSVILYTQE